jgi:hypothetical protein
MGTKSKHPYFKCSSYIFQFHLDLIEYLSSVSFVFVFIFNYADLLCNYANLWFFNLYFTLMHFKNVSFYQTNLTHHSKTFLKLGFNLDLIWIWFGFDFILNDLDLIDFFKDLICNFFIFSRFDLIWIWNTFYFSWFDQMLNNRHIQYTVVVRWSKPSFNNFKFKCKLKMSFNVCYPNILVDKKV